MSANELKFIPPEIQVRPVGDGYAVDVSEGPHRLDWLISHQRTPFTVRIHFETMPPPEVKRVILGRLDLDSDWNIPELNEVELRMLIAYKRYERAEGDYGMADLLRELHEITDSR